MLTRTETLPAFLISSFSYHLSLPRQMIVAFPSTRVSLWKMKEQGSVTGSNVEGSQVGGINVRLVENLDVLISRGWRIKIPSIE